ncbi:hypothetical protein [Tritonibacter aquimaris]|nr:hypothetical protein [Tritonibacter aquimaris]
MADKELTELDNLFAAARDEADPLPPALQMAILQDAERVQSGFAPDSPLPRAHGFTWALSLLGGGFGLGGVVCAGLVGLWIGFAPPSFLPDPVDYAVATLSTSSDAFDGFDLSELLDEDLQ